MRMKRAIAILAALALLVPAASAVVTTAGNQPDGILESVNAPDDDSGNDTAAKNFGTSQVDSTINWHDRPEFKATIQLWNNDTTSTNNYEDITYEVPDKNVLNSTDTANTWIESSTGSKFAFDTIKDGDGDGYPELVRTSSTAFESVPTSTKHNITIHFQMPKVSVTQDSTVELSEPEGKRVKYTVSSSEYLDYSNAVIQLSPPDFEDTIGGVGWTQEGSSRGVTVDVDAGTVTHTEATLSNQSETVKVNYNLPSQTAEAQPSPAVPGGFQVPTVASISETARSVLQGLFQGALSIVGLA